MRADVVEYQFPGARGYLDTASLGLPPRVTVEAMAWSWCGAAQGLGYGLLEEMAYHQGYPQALNYDEYLIPTSLDMPEIEATYIETDFPEGPYGAKNLAEPVLVATAPAIANAVYHATGVRHHTLPLTLEEQLYIFAAFLLAFAVKVPMWPVHTWLPDAHVEAPTGG